MSRVDLGIVAECEEHRSNRIQERGKVAARQVGATYRTCEQSIADEQLSTFRFFRADLQADSARAVAGGVMRSRGVFTELNDLADGVKHVHRRRSVHAKAKHGAVTDGILVQEQIIFMEIYRGAEHAFCRRDACDVIDVCMCQQDVLDIQRVLLRKHEQLVHLVTGIDEYGLTSRFTAEHEAVLEEGFDSPTLQYHEAVILALVDDLMFTSKIKTAARQLGVSVTFARSSETALGEMHATPPSLVIFDLNSIRLDPIGTAAAMHQDPALRTIPTIGFVSHVRADIIDAAREAGVGEVMARSAFTERLAEILTR